MIPYPLPGHLMDLQHTHTFALAAEALVAEQLICLGGTIIARRWRCRGGEIDLVVRSAEWLLFVEVKARSRGNWDSDGLEAVGAIKRRRLCRAARLFLQEHPKLAGLACRFDVALVRRDRQGGLHLQAYLSGAFDYTD